MDVFEQVVLMQDGVIELDLGITALKLLANVALRNDGAAGNQSVQLVEEDFVLDTLFEEGHGQVGALNHALIGVLSDELAIGEKSRGIASMLDFVAQFIFRDAQA